MQPARIERKLNVFCLFFCRTSNSAVSVTAGCLNKYSTVLLRFKIQKIRKNYKIIFSCIIKNAKYKFKATQCQDLLQTEPFHDFMIFILTLYLQEYTRTIFTKVFQKDVQKNIFKKFTQICQIFVLSQNISKQKYVQKYFGKDNSLVCCSETLLYPLSFIS